jgi:DNA modification methylase
MSIRRSKTVQISNPLPGRQPLLRRAERAAEIERLRVRTPQARPDAKYDTVRAGAAEPSVSIPFARFISSKGPNAMSFTTVIGTIRKCPIEQLKMYPQNARTHSPAQIQQIADSIREFGFVNPILIGTDDVIVAGHARWQAARQLEMSEVPVIVLAHLSEAQRRALTIADNTLATNAGWDEVRLRQELAALAELDFDLNLLGFADQELAQLLAAQDDASELTDPDAVPDPPPLPVSQPGDLWVLGKHRLLCGDATRPEDLKTVLAGATADMVFTDPPYNVAYRGKTKCKLTMQNDALGDGFYDFLRQASTAILTHCAGPVYVCMSSAELHTLCRAFTDAGGHWSTFVIWAKQHFTLGRADYQRQYEPILYGWREGADHYWCGARNQGDVWSIPRPAANRLHPTMKPVELVERAILNSSPGGAIVLDPFGGSGSTLIACQRQKRQARLLECEPRYVDVICERWQTFTGQAAVLESASLPFAEIAQRRQLKAA